MQYAEALREVKKAESEVRDLKSDAERQASQILREAERQANAMLEGARADAEAAYQKAVDGARKQAAAKRQELLKKGEADASKVRGRAAGPSYQEAVDLLVKKFEEHATRK